MAKNQRAFLRQIFRQVGDYSTLGLYLVAATCIGLAGGYYLDRWLGTEPIFTLIFLILGIVAGFINLFRTMKRILRQDNDD